MGRQKKEHFDADALLEAVAKQDHGIRISTNHPKGFLRIIYAAMRSGAPRAHVYASKHSPRTFNLLRSPLQGVSTSEEPSDAEG